MYHKNIGELMGKLKSRSISQLAQLGYLCNLLFLLMLFPWLEIVFLRSLFVRFPSIELSILTLGYTGLTFIAIIGFYGCYRMNQEGDGEDFLPRSICLAAYTLTWITSLLIIGGLIVWFTASSIELGKLAASYVRKYFADLMLDISMGLVIITWICYLFGFFRVRSYIYFVSQRNKII